MSNLIDELGVNYINERVIGAMFLKDGEAHVLEAAYDAGNLLPKETSVRARIYGANTEKLKKGLVTVPSSFFTSWKSLEWPTLGYRTAANNQILCYVSRRNSIRRGLNQRDVLVDFHDVAHAAQSHLGINLDHYAGPAIAPLTLCPKYTGFKEGLAKILTGEIPCFALSADFAVAPCADVEFLEILFRRRRIGTIDAKGNIKIMVDYMNSSWNHLIDEVKK